jgi:hypothetical protein
MFFKIYFYIVSSCLKNNIFIKKIIFLNIFYPYNFFTFLNDNM